MQLLTPTERPSILEPGVYTHLVVLEQTNSTVITPTIVLRDKSTGVERDIYLARDATYYIEVSALLTTRGIVHNPQSLRTLYTINITNGVVSIAKSSWVDITGAGTDFLAITSARNNLTGLHYLVFTLSPPAWLPVYGIVRLDVTEIIKLP